MARLRWNGHTAAVGGQGYWTTRGYSNSQSANSRTRKLADAAGSSSLVLIT